MDKQQVTNNITSPNEDLDILKKYFSNCFDKNGDFDFEKFKKELSKNEVNFSKESYSLEWLGKSYARLLASDGATTLLKENEEWNDKEENKNSGNILIKGDNLEVLKHLVNAYYEKIKMIYIDPPYNTGNDGFVYQDDRKFTVKELMELAGIDEERAKRILDFLNSKSNSHSAWLTFMYPRLYIARKLLREDGVIFVSIDDNEVAQLRILMDEIFGEENFVANIIWQTKKGAQGMTTRNMIVSNHEYILVYSKNNDNFQFLGRERSLKGFSNPDNDPRGVWKRQYLQRLGQGLPKRTIVNPNTGKKYIFETPYSQEKLNKWVEDGTIIFPSKENGYPAKKEFLNDYKNKQQLVTMLGLFPTKATTEKLYNLFDGTKIFTNPKPDTLIKFLLKSAIEKDDLVLDFFAGSGTTGDAVMQLNAEDGGSRKYILVQLPELIDPKKKKTAYEFVKNELGIEEPTIFEITKERLIRASKKIKEETITKKIEEKEKEIEELEGQLDLEDKEEKINQLKEEIENLENQDLGFKIFEAIPIWEGYLADEKELTEQTTLFEASNLTEDDLKALLITWKTYDGLPLTEKCKEVKLNNYTAYYCGTNLYLLYSNWKTENIKTLLEKIDSERDFVVEKIIVFGYNFNSKDLREIEENIRNYSNKKQIKIETILRF